MKDKYKPLADYLKLQAKRNSDHIVLNFQEIEKLLDDCLPASAYKYRAWWANQKVTETRPQARAWIEAGFTVDSIRIAKGSGTISFKRTKV